ncbi:hypothetical protein [Paratractidigestivibacter sp.]|uniref:hypothetical protein n=1 Tax=Paratractidigestivibacter sp. TaxID=2847316 RepID=UPI002AC8E899|nr:hypothetical protein [Paratractidigestivibacter sp.]
MAMTMEGMQDVIRMFDDAPKEMKDDCRKAMGVAARKVSAQIRRGTPQRWRKLVKAKAKASRRSKMLYASMGLYFSRTVQGHQPKAYRGTKDGITDWFKAYWANYGTLTKRDPTHHFQYKVKADTKWRRNDIGQGAEKFFEASTRGWESVFMGSWVSALEQKGYKMAK